MGDKLSIVELDNSLNMMNCLYCGDPTNNKIELGRGNHIKKIPCCQKCFYDINELIQHQQKKMEKMAEYAAMLEIQKER